MQIQDHPHSALSQDKAKLIKIRNKNICVVDGLPKDITRDAVKSKNWYGRFEGIVKVEMKRRKKELEWSSAWITFDKQKQRDDAIIFTNSCTFDDGRILKAMHGWNYYCKHFLNNKKCPKTKCQDIHEWVKDPINDIIVLVH